MKTKQTKKRVSYRLNNSVCGMIKIMAINDGKTATQIVEEAIVGKFNETLCKGDEYEKS